MQKKCKELDLNNNYNMMMMMTIIADGMHSRWTNGVLDLWSCLECTANGALDPWSCLEYTADGALDPWSCLRIKTFQRNLEYCCQNKVRIYNSYQTFDFHTSYEYFVLIYNSIIREGRPPYIKWAPILF